MSSFLRSRAAAAALGAALTGGLLVAPALVLSSTGPAGGAERCASPSASGQPNPIQSIIGQLPIGGSPSPSATPTASVSPSPSATATATTSSSPSPCGSGSPQS